MPSPNVGDVRQFLGIVNQMSKFIPNLAEKSQPLRDLLTKDNQWSWGTTLQMQSLCQIKQALTKSPILALFNLNYETAVEDDASCFGLGAVLTRSNQMMKSIISRSITSAEKGMHK